MTPTIFDLDESGLNLSVPWSKWGPLGEPFALTAHHSAGPKASSKARAQALNRAYQLSHIERGFGNFAYHFTVDEFGRVYRCRPLKWKGAHVGGHNTGNIGFMFYGNYEFESPSKRMRQTIEWLFEGGINELTGFSENDLALARGHREWPGHSSNACPGDNLMRHWAWRRSVSFHRDKD